MVMLERPTLVEQGEFEPQVMAFCNVDLGSTIGAFGYTLIIEDSYGVHYLDSTPVSSFEWASLAERVDSPTGVSYKCLRGENLHTVMHVIKEGVRQVDEALSEQDLGSVMSTVTGLGHSLVVEWGEEGDRTNRVLLLDGPSLYSDKFTNKQSTILKSIGFFDNPNKHILSLMKLMTLRNNPAIVEEMCGQGISFEELRFSTMHGLVAHALGSSDKEAGVPLVDLRDLSNKNIANDTERVLNLFLSLGVRPDQVHINLSPYSFSDYHHIVFRNNDFVTVCGLIAFAREIGAIYPNSVVIELDTIGKIVSKNLQFLKVSGESGEYYNTQRMTGDINSKWLWHLYHTPEGKIDFDAIATTLEVVSDWSNEYQEFFYDPDDHTGGNERGTLRYVDDEGQYQILQPEMLPRLGKINQKKATLAIITGMFFGIRAKIDAVLPQGEAFPTVEFYGGLITYGGKPWEKIIRQIFWKSDAFRLIGIDGFAAAGLAAAKKQNIRVDHMRVQEIPLDEQPANRQEEYIQWCKLTGKM